MLEQTFSVKSYDVDPHGLVKISSLQKYMQQIAREDSALYGATYEAMRRDSMVFVITRLALKFLRPVYDGDIITMRTINNEIRGASFDREFEFYDVNGNLIAAATTLWVLLNFEKRTVMRPRALKFDIPQLHLPIPGVEVIKRLISSEDSLRFVGTRKVGFSDLDENDHLNNTFYSDIVSDFSPFSLYDYRISELQISFLTEARLGDTLEISVTDRGDGFALEAKNTRTGSNCFEAHAGLVRI